MPSDHRCQNYKRTTAAKTKKRTTAVEYYKRATAVKTKKADYRYQN